MRAGEAVAYLFGCRGKTLCRSVHSSTLRTARKKRFDLLVTAVAHGGGQLKQISRQKNKEALSREK